MSLRDLAKADHASILSDTVTGFSELVTVTSPAGIVATVPAMPCDIGQVIDPQTGIAVLGRYVTVTLLLAPLVTAGLGEPRGIAESSSKPWLVSFPDTRGVVRTWKVQETATDHVFGSVNCILEAYRPG